MLTTLLRSLKEMRGYQVQAADGDIGTVHDFYFDDEFWVIRYLAADAPLGERPIWVSTFAFEEPDWENKVFFVKLNRKASHDSLAPDPRLRSMAQVLGYRIHAKDGDIGYVDDFIVNDADWAIHYLVVNTRNWLPEKKVVISPWWTDEIRWKEAAMVLGMPKQAIQNSPEYDFRFPVSREYEEELYNYYNKPRYWS